MAGRHMLPTSPHHLSPALIGQIQSQAMSHAKFAFLIALVVFFVALFVVAYLWMRRPDFGQKGSHSLPASSGRTLGDTVQLRPSATRPDAEADADAVAMRAPRNPDVP